MPVTHSPLRYPGGKTSIYSMISRVIDDNNLSNHRYVEPYAGGGGLALALLFNAKVKEIHLNDLDRSIWSIWHCILNETESFCKKILETEVTIEEWFRQREIQEQKNDADILDLAYSSFFLNRTNRSGIILKAGVIGGLSQKSKYPLHCRFNKIDLVEKIKKISSLRKKIFIYNKDARIFMNNMDKRKGNTLFFIDPPYYEKGSSLYTNSYTKNDHEIISKTIKNLTSEWILTYDNHQKIKEIYSSEKMFEFNLNYSAATKRVGTEVIVFGNSINTPADLINVKLIEVDSLDAKCSQKIIS